MNIGLKIKELRLENNLTQEDLAEQLGVSFQAVSRWENNVTYPDITMLPIIANMFSVTVDYLLDVDISKKNQEIYEILEEDRMLFNQENINERETVLLNGLKKYPNNWNLKNNLLSVYFTKSYDDEEYYEKAVKISYEILDKCVIDDIRYYAMQSLVYMYIYRKNLEEAKKIVEKLPLMIISKNYLWADVVKGEERIKAVQSNFIDFVEMFYSKLVVTYGREEAGKRDIQLLKYKIILDTVFENQDYGFYNTRLARIYMLCARDQARIQNKDKTLSYLKLALKHEVIFMEMYNSKKVLKHTSFLVDRLEDDPTLWSFSEEPQSIDNFEDEIKDELFDFIRGENEYKEIINDIKNIKNSY